MRPVRLEMEGFGAFRERSVVDLERADLFALVGATGAGKSTVLDAMTFALYGSVSRYDDEKRVAPVITTGAQQARVALDFDAGSERYRVARVIRRRDAGAATKAIGLERLGGGEPELVADRERDVTLAVERIVGLSFQDFTRCVVLPQGEFATFLHDKPTRRQEILVRLLDLGIYERVGQRARDLGRDARARIDAARAQLAAMADATPEALAEALRRRDALSALLSRIEAEEPEMRRLDGEVDAARRQAREASDLARRLGGVAVPEAARDLGAARAKALAEEARCRARGEELLAEEDRVARERGSMPSVAELALAARAHQELAALAGELAAERRRSAGAEKAVTAAEGEESGARVAAREAEEELGAARHAHAAHQLARDLVAGEPCPVCRQPVAKVPRGREPKGLAEAEKALQAARTAAERAGKRAGEAREALAGLRARLDAREKRERELGTAVKAHPDPAALVEVMARVERIEVRQREAREARQAVERDRARAAASLEKTKAAAAELSRRLDAERDALAALQPPAPGREDVAADWEALARWAAARRPAEQERARAADLLAEEHGRARDRKLSDLWRDGAKAGLAPAPGGAASVGGAPSVRDLVKTAAAAVAQAEAGVTRLQERLLEGKRLRDAMESEEEAERVAHALGQHLKATAFPAWILQEVLARLAQAASRTLERLSGGHYALLCDDRNEWMVMDHRQAGEIRPARTLSGGETFQASLALALALADEVARVSVRGGARLGSLFLDEGFGTLDEDALETVAATLETLGAQTERMVGIVTHVRPLAERMPVRYLVRNDGHTARVDREEPA